MVLRVRGVGALEIERVVEPLLAARVGPVHDLAHLARAHLLVPVSLAV